jgi:putative transcriptional regulator
MVVINLYNLIQRRGWTQKELSARTSVRKATISDMCNNISKALGISNLNKLCKALGCKIEDLIEYIPDDE